MGRRRAAGRSALASALCSSSRPPVDHQPTCFARMQAFAAASNITMEGIVELIGMTALQAVSGRDPSGCRWQSATRPYPVRVLCAHPGCPPCALPACPTGFCLACDCCAGRQQNRVLVRRCASSASDVWRGAVCNNVQLLKSITGDSWQAQAVNEAWLGMGNPAFYLSPS